MSDRAISIQFDRYMDKIFDSKLTELTKLYNSSKNSPKIVKKHRKNLSTKMYSCTITLAIFTTSQQLTKYKLSEFLISLSVASKMKGTEQSLGCGQKI